MVFPHLPMVFPTSFGPTDLADPADISRHGSPPAVGDLELPMSLAPWRQTCSVFFRQIRKVMSYDLRNPKNIEASGWCLNIPSGERLHFAMERSTIFHGKIHYK